MKTQQLLLGITAIASFNISPAIALTQIAQTPQINAYPSSLVDSYVKICLNGKAVTRAFCVCTINKIQDRMPLSEFIDYSLTASKDLTTPTPPLFKAVATECIADLSQNPQRSLSSSPARQPLSPRPQLSRPLNTSSNAYPAKIVASFVKSCSEVKKVPRTFCTCTMTEAQKRLPFKQFVEWSLKLVENRSTPMPRQFKNSILACSIKMRMPQV